MGVRLNKSLCTLFGIGPPDPCGGIGGTLHTTVVYEELIFANSFVRLKPAEEIVGTIGVDAAELATIAPV